MTTEEFRADLQRRNMSQSKLAALIQAWGDPAQPATILRRVQRWATGEAKVPGEAIAFLRLLEWSELA